MIKPFTQHVYEKYGIGLPRKARDQAKCGIKVDRADLHKGGLLFFYVPESFPPTIFLVMLAFILR
ncbi:MULTISPECIES: NlpC/P60 family protein [unclassified Paenibacillus]